MNETREIIELDHDWVGMEAFFKKGIADRTFTGNYDGDDGVIEAYRELVICNFLNGDTTFKGNTLEETLQGQGCIITKIYAGPENFVE